VTVTRHIYCRSCGNGWAMNLKDLQVGWNGWRVWLIVEGSSLQCEACGLVVADGQTCVAVTMFRAGTGSVPLHWEHEYGTVIPEEQVRVTDALEKAAK
jgi:hypothetical protein